MQKLEVRLSTGQRKFYEGPGHWNEVTKPSLYRKLYRLRRIGYHLPTTRFIAMRLVYRMPERVSRLFFGSRNTSIREDSLLNTADRAALIGTQLFQTVSWIWNNLPTHRWHVRKLRVLWRTYTGPDDEFRTMTFGQFMFTERYFSDTLQPAGYKKAVLMLVASLYVRKGKPFDPEQIEANARWLRWIPGDLQEAIVCNYEGLRYQLTRDFKEVFDPPQEETPKKALSSTSAGWLDIALSLAGDDLGKLYDYEKAELWVMMKVLQNAMIRQKELASANK